MSDTAWQGAMRRALALAEHGPVVGGNPQVGCVIVDDTGAIRAEGFHAGAGSAHAEVVALAALADAGRMRADGSPDARGLTAVVTLEPCDHTGATGPCSRALLAAGIDRVAYAVADPGAHSGGGARTLAAGGVEVVAGVEEAAAESLLHVWLTAMRRGRPWVTVKWASTLDGRIAAADGTSRWITGPPARDRVHAQRAASDAILTSTGTVLADDPALTARGPAGDLLPHQPLPVVVGERPLPRDAAIRRHPRAPMITGDRDLRGVLARLHDDGIRRVFVEAGPTVVSALIADGLTDDYAIYLAPLLVGGDRLGTRDLGIATLADGIRLHPTAVERLGDDLLVTATPVPQEA